MMPEKRRVAIHQAGHAVVQTLVGRGRFAVLRVSLEGEHGGTWRGLPARGEATIDREVDLGLYEFGLVTLAGIAAENRYLFLGPQAADPLVAPSDLAEWQEKAREILGEEARIRVVGLNIMRKLQEWLSDETIWGVVENLAEELLARETLQGPALRRILALLEGGEGDKIPEVSA
jgi:hypothetical protein